MTGMAKQNNSSEEDEKPRILRENSAANFIGCVWDI